MTDVRLTLTPTGGDLSLKDGDLELDQGLETAVLVSVLSEARAPDLDQLDTLATNPRGFWPDTSRDRFGSLLWQLEREKRLPKTAQAARDAAIASLGWMVEDGVAGALEAQASFDAQGVLDLDVQIARGSSKKYAGLWAGTSGTTAVKIAPLPAPPEPPTTLPNIFVFLLDDGGAEMVPWSGLAAPTQGYPLLPRLQGFRALGITFLNAYATAICGPTRARLESGSYGLDLGLAGNLDGPNSIGFQFAFSDTGPYATLLANAIRLGKDGTADPTLPTTAFTYAIFWGGKCHLCADAGEESYPKAVGYGRYVGCQPNAAALAYWPFGQHDPNVPPQSPIVEDDGSGHFHFRETSEALGTGPITSRIFGDAGSYVVGGANAKFVAWDPSQTPPAAWDAYKVYRDVVSWANSRTQPFVAKVCFNPPHAPFEVPPYTAPDTVGFDPSGLTFDVISPATQAAMTALDGGGKGPGYRAADGSASEKAVYNANMEAFDTLVGKIYDQLDPAIRANSIFIVMGDNGTVSNIVQAPYDPGHAKRSLYEMGRRVPMVVWGPSPWIQSPGRDSTHLLHITDVFATVLDLIGANETLWNPEGRIIRGRSFAPLLASAGAPPHRGEIYDELFLPFNGTKTGFPAPITRSQWHRVYSDGTYSIIAHAPQVAPAFEFYKITSENQPASGQGGYFELAADNLIPLTTLPHVAVHLAGGGTGAWNLNGFGRVAIKDADGVLRDWANLPDRFPPIGSLAIQDADGSTQTVPFVLAGDTLSTRFNALIAGLDLVVST